MAEVKTINTRIVLRNDTLENWNNSTKPLLKGEAALALRTDGKYEIRFGSEDSLSSWPELISKGQLVIPAKNVEFLTYQEYKLSSLTTEEGEQSKFQLWGKKSDTGVWESIGNAITVPEVDFGPVNANISFLSDEIGRLCTEVSANVDALSTSLSNTVDELVSTTKTDILSEVRSVSGETLISAAATAQSKANTALADAKAYANTISTTLSTDYQGKIDDIYTKIKDGIHVIGKVSGISSDTTATPNIGYYTQATPVPIELTDWTVANNGDLVILSSVEYLWASSTQSWEKLGDESTWASKTYVDEAKAAAIAATKNTVQTVSDYSALVNGTNTGDVGIVRKEIGTTGKYEMSAYTWDADGSTWVPMDQYYSADNVIMPDNFKITYTFGKYSPDSTGSKQLTCAGMTVKDFIKDAFQKTEHPTNSVPTCSKSYGSNLGGTSYEVGSYVTSLNGATFKYTADGKYTSYNDNHVAACSVMLSSIYLKREAQQAEDFNGNVFNLDAINETKNDTTATTAIAVGGTVSIESENSTNISVQITDSNICLAKYTLSGLYCKGTYTPKNNLGEDDADAIIPAGSFGTTTGYISCCAGSRRRFWYVGTDYTTTADNDFFRGIADSNHSDFNATTKTKDLTIAAGTKRVLLTYMNNSATTKATLKSVIDVDGMGLDIKDKFTSSIVAIKGANGFDAKYYTVFSFVNENGVNATTFKITIN